MIEHRPTLRLAFAAALLALASGHAWAATFKDDYAISLVGLPLATANLVSTIEGTSYRTQMQARTTGLAGIAASGKGASSAAGSVPAGHPLPATFALASRSSKGPMN